MATLTTTDFVPTTFSDMFQHYYPYVVKLVAKMGIDQQSTEDVAMTILTKFYEKDALSDFDPTFQTSHGGVVRSAKFRTFLSGFVVTYVQHYRTRQTKQAYRECISTDQPSNQFEGLTWLDFHGPSVTDNHEDLEEQDLLRGIRAHLLESSSSNNQDRCNLPEFFEAIQTQLEVLGKIDVAALSVTFGVCNASVRNWIKRLRTEVSKVIEVV